MNRRPVPSDPAAREAAFNASSLDQWDRFAPHRRRVSALLGAGGPTAGARLCVLGAGNCNDLDLPALRAVYREVHLVDIDAGALAAAVARQGLDEGAGVRLWGGVDLTGMNDTFARWTPRSEVTDADLAALADWPYTRVGLAIGGGFERVASTCLLSQLIGNAYRSVGETHPRFREVVGAIRLGHLRALTSLVGPGGTAVLVADAVSSLTVTDLGTRPEASLAKLFARLGRGVKIFHGADPVEITDVVRNDPPPGVSVSELETLPPWRWHLHDRVYLVWALRYRVNAKAR